MSAPRPAPSRVGILAAIVGKDLRTFSRDRFWLFMTALGLFWFVALYYLLPDTVDETIRVGVHWTEREAAFEASFGQQEGIEWVRYDSREALEEGLGLEEAAADEERSLRERIRDTLGIGEDGDEAAPEPVDIGIDYPEDFLVRVHLTVPTTVTLYVGPEVPEDVRQAMSAGIRESAYALTGYALPVTMPSEETVLLGDGPTEGAVPLREKALPLYAFFALMLETFALGALIAEEVSSRTVTAVLATPAGTADFLLAKGLVGTVVAFSEAALLLVLVRSYGNAPVMLTVTLVMGAILATGVALLVGASGRDFIGIVFYSLVFLIPLVIPAMAELFPGTASPWVKVLPSYGLVQAIVIATSGAAEWSDVAAHLAGLAVWCLVFLTAGLLVLRRKVKTL